MSSPSHGEELVTVEHTPHYYQASLETSGGDTELDKSVIERVQDPLLHILRNSIDHGLDVLPLRASDVLATRAGLCFGKSHLLAALFRANGVLTYLPPSSYTTWFTPL